jgi:hypothetical protein
MSSKTLLKMLALTAVLNSVCAAGILQDDRYTVGLWHMDEANYNVTHDDVNNVSRLVNNMSLAMGGGGQVATVTDVNEGVYGQAIDFGTSGRVLAAPSINWPISKEFRFEGWVDFNSLPTEIMPPPAAYYFLFISDTAGNSAVVRMYVDVADDDLVAEYVLNDGSTTTCIVPLAGKSNRWLHILAYCGDDGAGTNASLSVYDATDDVTVTDAHAITGVLQQLSYPIYIGQLPATAYSTNYTPWRGFRGRLDEVKMTTSVLLPPRLPHEPSPASGITGLTYAPQLAWYSGGHAIRSEIYFGTNLTEVSSAQRLGGDIDGNGVVDINDICYVVAQWMGQPEPPCPDIDFDRAVNFVDYAVTAGDYGKSDTAVFQGFTTVSAYEPQDVLPNTTYYWRTDSVDCNGITTGPVWSFSTGTAKASVPDPANNTTGVSWGAFDNKVTLSWAKAFAGSSTRFDVYFGTSSTSPAFFGSTTAATMKTPVVAVNKKYYWKVNTVTSGVTTTGDIWNFTTQTLPSFPGAEGFGRTVTGARGATSPTVYHVTNLNASGTGSLAAGVSGSNRYIVFDVGGYINITDKLGITGTNITIAGQTAPGGIGIRSTSGGGISCGGNNVIIRHLYLRPGKASSGSHALNINSDAQNIMVDHCSMMFSTDENNSMDNPLVATVQWSFNAWGLQGHSCGALLYANSATIHHTLWAHNHTRNPKARNGLLDWVNNVVFDWGIPFICADSSGGNHYANVKNCYFISGGSTDKAFTSAQTDSSGNPTFHMYLSGTLTDLDGDGVLNGTDKGYSVIGGRVEQRSTPYSSGYTIDTDNALTAYKRVLSLGGAMPWARDEVDALLVSDVKNHVSRIISTESDLPVSNAGYGTLGVGMRPTDTDNDGMPDFWEDAVNLNKASASDFNLDRDSDGYKNLEEYLNWLGAPNAQTAKNTYIDVDLRKYTAGFNSGATYSVANAVNGTVAMNGSYTARFTPTTNFNGLGRFDFTVNDGSSMTVTVNVLVKK